MVKVDPILKIFDAEITNAGLEEKLQPFVNDGYIVTSVKKLEDKLYVYLDLDSGEENETLDCCGYAE